MNVEQLESLNKHLYTCTFRAYKRFMRVKGILYRHDELYDAILGMQEKWRTGTMEWYAYENMLTMINHDCVVILKRATEVVREVPLYDEDGETFYEWVRPERPDLSGCK